MKKLCLLLVSILLVCLLVPASAGDPLDAFLSAADSLMDRLENQYCLESNSTQAVRTYIAGHDYPSLISGRIICSDQMIGASLLTQIPLELYFPDDAQAELEDMGKTAALENIRTGIDRDFEFRFHMIRTMYDYMCSDFCIAGMEDALSRLLDARSTYLICNAAFVELALNAALLDFDLGRAKAWWNELPGRFPTLGASLVPFQEDLSSIQALFANYSLQNEIAVNTTNSIMAELNEAWQEFHDAAENKNREKLLEDFLPPSALPAICPLPDAWLGADACYLFAESGSGADSVPDQVTIFVHNANLELFRIYADSLDLPRDSCTGSDESGWQYSFDGGKLVLEWTPDTQTMITYDALAYTMETMTFMRVLAFLAS